MQGNARAQAPEVPLQIAVLSFNHQHMHAANTAQLIDAHDALRRVGTSVMDEQFCWCVNKVVEDRLHYEPNPHTATTLSRMTTVWACLWPAHHGYVVHAHGSQSDVQIHGPSTGLPLTAM